MIGEIICTCIAQAYISHGGGFSHCAAGISHRGANEMLEDDYRVLQLKIFADPGFLSRMDEETKKTQQLINELRDNAENVQNTIAQIGKLSIDMPLKFQDMKNAEAAQTRLESEYVEKARPLATLLQLLNQRNSEKEIKEEANDED